MADKDVKMANNSSNTNKKEESKEDKNKGDKDKKAGPKIIEVVFNEDDAFEEFEMDTWKVDKNTSKQEDADLWQDDWGDKDVDEAFEVQLRNEIQSNAKK